MSEHNEGGYGMPLVLKHIRVTEAIDQEVQAFADQFNMSWTAAANILLIYGKAALENQLSAVSA